MSVHRWMLPAAFGLAAFTFSSTGKAAEIFYGTGGASNPGIFELRITPDAPGQPTSVTQTLVLTGSGNNAIAIDRGRNQLFFIDGGNTLEVWKPGNASTIQVATSAQLGITGVPDKTFSKPLGGAFDNSTGSYWFFSAQTNGNNSTSTNESNVLNRVDFTYDMDNTPVFSTRTSYRLNEVPNFPPATGCTSNPCNRFGDFVISPDRMLFAQVTSQGTANFDRLFQVDLDELDGFTLGTLLNNVTDAGYASIIDDVGIANLQIAYSSDFNRLYGVSSDNNQWYEYTLSGSNPTNTIPSALAGVISSGQIVDITDSGTTAAVPLPLPIAGAAVGMAWSRKLRRRISASSNAASQ